MKKDFVLSVKSKVFIISKKAHVTLLIIMLCKFPATFIGISLIVFEFLAFVTIGVNFTIN